MIAGVTRRRARWGSITSTGLIALCAISRLGVVLPPEPVAEAPAVDPNVANWLDAQARQRGLAPVTIARHGRMLAQILPLIGTDPSGYTARIIRDGLLEHARTARSVHYPKMVASALRLYLRHLAHRGLAVPDLDRAVPSAKTWRLASLPRYLQPDAVERLMVSCDPQTPGGRRDRAILLLLARLGLRARDMAELRLSDIDWQAATLRVCGKRQREVRLPLPQDAGDAFSTRHSSTSEPDLTTARTRPEP